MAFQKDNCGPVSAQANTDFPKIWGYRYLDDTAAELVAGGYFDAIGPLLHVNDYLMAHCADGALFGTFQNDGTKWYVDVLIAEGASSVKYDDVLSASSFNIQQPSATDSPIQIEFGAPQVTELVDLDALGNLTFLVAGSYNVRLRFLLGRTGQPGNAVMFIRALFNGAQIGTSVHTVLDDSNDVIPATFEGRLNISTDAEPNDVLSFELYRDSSGNNAGGLFPATATLSGWGDSPSAVLTLSRLVF